MISREKFEKDDVRHIGKPLAPHHINLAIHRQAISDGCLKAYQDINPTRRHGHEMSFDEKTQIKRQILFNSENCSLICDTLSPENLQKFSAVLLPGELQKLKRSWKTDSDQSVILELLLCIVRSAKKNPTWWEVLEKVLLTAGSLDLYHSMNPWEPQPSCGGAAAGGNGGNRRNRRRNGSKSSEAGPPYARSTPLSETKGIGHLLNRVFDLSNEVTWRDLGNNLDLDMEDQLEIKRESKDKDIQYLLLLDKFVERHEDAATVDRLLGALQQLGEEGQLALRGLERNGLIYPMNRESEGGGDVSCVPYNNEKEGSSSVRVAQRPTSQFPPGNKQLRSEPNILGTGSQTDQRSTHFRGKDVEKLGKESAETRNPFDAGASPSPPKKLTTEDMGISKMLKSASSEQFEVLECLQKSQHSIERKLLASVSQNTFSPSDVTSTTSEQNISGRSVCTTDTNMHVPQPSKKSLAHSDTMENSFKRMQRSESETAMTTEPALTERTTPRSENSASAAKPYDGELRNRCPSTESLVDNERQTATASSSDLSVDDVKVLNNAQPDSETMKFCDVNANKEMDNSKIESELKRSIPYQTNPPCEVTAGDGGSISDDVTISPASPSLPTVPGWLQESQQDIANQFVTSESPDVVSTVQQTQPPHPSPEAADIISRHQTDDPQELTVGIGPEATVVTEVPPEHAQNGVKNNTQVSDVLAAEDKEVMPETNEERAEDLQSLASESFATQIYVSQTPGYDMNATSALESFHPSPLDVKNHMTYPKQLCGSSKQEESEEETSSIFIEPFKQSHDMNILDIRDNDRQMTSHTDQALREQPIQTNGQLMSQDSLAELGSSDYEPMTSLYQDVPRRPAVAPNQQDPQAAPNRGLWNMISQLFALIQDAMGGME